MLIKTITEIQDLYNKIPLPDNFHGRAGVICNEIYNEYRVFEADAQTKEQICLSLRKKLQDNFDFGESFSLMEDYFRHSIFGLDLLDLILPTSGWECIELRSYEQMRFYPDAGSMIQVIYGDFWFPRDVRNITDRIAAELGLRFDAKPESHVIKSHFLDGFHITGSYREHHSGVLFYITRNPRL